jgi:hypothetical protein
LGKLHHICGVVNADINKAICFLGNSNIIFSNEGDDTLTANRNGTNNIQALAGDDTITGGIDARNNIDGDLRTFTLLFYVVLFLVLY